MFPLIFGLFTIIWVPTSDAQQLVSPCPNLFTYEPEGVVGDHWYGNIRLVSDVELSGLWMRTIFDRPPLKLESNFGEVVSRETSDFLIRRPKNKINQGELISIRIKVQFDPANGVPQLAGFRLNGAVKCPENGVIATPMPAPEVLISPCPELFAYEPPGTETDRWYGVIQLKSPKELNGVWLRVILDQPSSQLGVSSENWFGEVTTDDNKEYLIKNRNHKLRPGETTPLRFFIKYNPGDPVPKLQSFRINAETVCPTPGGTPSAQRPTQPNWVPPTTPTPTQNRPVYGGDFDPNSRPVFLPARDPQGGNQCGIVAAKPRPLITFGDPTIEGQWPWHVALYNPQPTGIKYICGATLVSLTHILTAGHCVAVQNSNAPITSEDIEVYLGKWSLKKFSSTGIQNIQVKIIYMHPEYDHLTYRNDIALIQLIKPAEYTDWVRPVCLWAENTDISSVVDRNGTVVGWGYDQTGKVTDQLNKAILPVVPHDKCIWSNPAFFSKFATNTTFCAGDREGTSVCNGDSGGALVFPKQYTNSDQIVWQIRGLVSISIALQSDLICDTSHYAIFTDVAKYMDWIRISMLR